MGNTQQTLFLCFGLISLACGFHVLNVTSQPLGDLSKGHLENVSLNRLTSGYLNRVYPDAMSLRISHSKIDKIDKYAFDHLIHLNLLEISDSEIQEQIDSETFSRLPSLEILVLRNVGLRNAFLNLTNVQELILAGNKIEVVMGDLLKGRNVNYLDLSDNKLTTLGRSFANFSKLSRVDISKNELSQIPPVFEKNTNLISIRAAQNKITSTEGLRLSWLKTLDLFANRITALDSTSFSGMKSLEELVLVMNSIRYLDDAFKDLIELKYLNLAWNNIEQLHPELFRNNLYLTKLFLQGNNIESLAKFQNVLPHLTHLDISHNKLVLVQDEFFQSTPRLEVLDLSFNHLKTIAGTMKPLAELKILNLAFNNLIMNGDELSSNGYLTRVNLSFNALEEGLKLFKNNQLLSNLDLSHNNILHFCDRDIELKNLIILSLKGNKINNLNCLKNLKSLCEVNLRENPLSCGEDLDDLIKTLAERRGSPHYLVPEFQEDLPNQCENLSLNRSLDLWNSIKRELCPKGRDLEVSSKTKEWGSVEKTDSKSIEDSTVESFETMEGPVVSRKPIFLKKFHPIEWIRNDELNKPNPLQNPQSEKSSWEKIEKKDPELLKGFEDEELGRRPRFTWHTIALILIGLSLTLTCFNLAVFLYIKMKVWRKSDSSPPQKYTVLHNEVYRNTTEPNQVHQVAEGDWVIDNQTKNKIFTYGKINELLLNFGSSKKDKDSESAKNILISSTSNAPNC